MRITPKDREVIEAFYEHTSTRRTASEVIRTLENRVARLERESGLFDKVKDFFTEKPRSRKSIPAVWVEQDAFSPRGRPSMNWIATKDPKRLLSMLKMTELRVNNIEKHGGLTFMELGNVRELITHEMTRAFVDALKIDQDFVYRRDKNNTEEIDSSMVMEAKKLHP